MIDHNKLNPCYGAAIERRAGLIADALVARYYVTRGRHV